MAYPAEFREEVVALATSVGALEAADRYGVAFRTVYHWVEAACVTPARYGLRQSREDVRLSPDRVGVNDDGTLDVACWCERRVVRVPAQRLRDGLTDSCGLRWCVPCRAA